MMQCWCDGGATSSRPATCFLVRWGI